MISPSLVKLFDERFTAHWFLGVCGLSFRRILLSWHRPEPWPASDLSGLEDASPPLPPASEETVQALSCPPHHWIECQFPCFSSGNGILKASLQTHSFGFVTYLSAEKDRLSEVIIQLRDRLKGMEAAVASQTRAIEDLKREVDARKDYEELKQELRSLKSASDAEPPMPPSPSSTPSAADDEKASIKKENIDPSRLTAEQILHEIRPREFPLDGPGIPKSDPLEGRLQDMLRYNMEIHQHTTLDTLFLARRVRELLSIHNIGQRLFAKYVLGLSQGTVSELLSKPKPWDKLTEKGRDSYRKMHAWAIDDNAVQYLKSLVPKRGSGVGSGGGSMPAIIPRDSPAPSLKSDEASDTEEKISRILSEAQKVMKQQQESQSQTEHPNNAQLQQRLFRSSQDRFHPGTPEDVQRRSENQSDNLLPGLRPEKEEDMQAKMSRLYQEQLARLMSTGAHRGPEEDQKDMVEQYQKILQSSLHPAMMMRRSREEVQMAIHLYQQELSKMSALQDSQSGDSGARGFPERGTTPQDLSMKQVNGNSDSEPSEDDKSRKSAFSLVKVEMGASPPPSRSASSTPSSPQASPATCASPLQRMQNITNALITQQTVAPISLSTQRPNRPVLPPITQQQFDKYQTLNTEEVVRRVKEQLSQFSISQRLFGESVLGLSQGSVSDLLARPKPWHMLTQKGGDSMQSKSREPFIRMQMFLEDGSAVHKLVASQYKIAPEKLMRTGNFGGAGAAAAVALNSLPRPPSIDSNKKMPSSPSPSAPGSDPAGALSALSAPPGCPPGFPPGFGMPGMTSGSFPLQFANPAFWEYLRKSYQLKGVNPQSQNVYELAAMMPDMDTQAVTNKIKEVLLANNVGQKLFGEVVLGLSQGSVSELLSKPKPWHMLSIKGREPFVRMQMWLNDPQNIDNLQRIKSERRDVQKRKRSHTDMNNDNSSDSTDRCSTSPSSPSTPQATPSKKQRVLFTDEQKEALRLAYQLDTYPNVTTIEFLAQELGLPARTISNWFHNHRMRLKQHNPNNPDSSSLSPPNPGSKDNGGSFDPMQFRILLNQRLMEMVKERNPVLALPPNPFLGLPSDPSQLGLDLSLSAKEGSEAGEEEPRSPAEQTESDAAVRIKEDASETSDHSSECTSTSQSRSAGSSSRRKSAAPQWVNPDWVSQASVLGSGPVKSEPSGDGETGKASNGGSNSVLNGVTRTASAADAAKCSEEEEEEEERVKVIKCEESLVSSS
ncbi:unnamed protein product [Cyprideis torosa]|uniref:Homeobox protein cut-like n=1 Tax=Cyprideis torosa TaxID=163714 RepID=A0A7R8W3F7_9CRUS|nr:unnamed protein product [Cyprideis torosa]CAG0879605.1 unnamed protein product [Cyprideis torosa]